MPDLTRKPRFSLDATHGVFIGLGVFTARVDSRAAQRLGPGRTVATVICDSGLKYLSTDQYHGDDQ